MTKPKLPKTAEKKPTAAEVQEDQHEQPEAAQEESSKGPEGEVSLPPTEKMAIHEETPPQGDTARLIAEIVPPPTEAAPLVAEAVPLPAGVAPPTEEGATSISEGPLAVPEEMALTSAEAIPEPEPIGSRLPF